MAFNLSSSPHVRGSRSTHSIMWDVVIALIPTTAFGVYYFGIYSLLILLVSVGFAVLSEFTYQKLTGQDVLISDGSAVLTGLLLGLNMPASVPLWMPALGSIFAVMFVKQFFGGLGQNFMNPALGGRCFLLISFTSTMSNFTVAGVDATSGATPLAALKAGETVDLAAMFFGFTGGTIGEVSTFAILLGGIYLLVKRIISWEIPVCYLGTFAIFMFIFGGQGFSPMFVLAHLFGGGIMLGAWFMATDYVTSPITKKGKIVFGILLGILTGLFRTFGVSAEGVSYAIIFSNLLVPLIEKVTMPKAFGLENVKKEKAPKAVAEATEEAAEETEAVPEEKNSITLKVYKAALNLCCITLVAGLLLGVVYQMTKGPIEEAEIAAAAAAYQAVCPQADSFGDAEDIVAAGESISGGAFGNVSIDEAFRSLDANKECNGYVIVATSKDGFGGEITISLGTDLDGKITGLEFLTLNETAGLGMNAAEDSFKGQYVGVATDKFTVVKGGKSSDNEIDALSGATITSNAVTNAVNAALSVISAVQ